MKNSIDKKTAVTVSIIFAIILAAMLLIVPIQRKNEFYAKWGKLAELAETDERAKFITENEDLYPEEILKYFYSHSDELDFVYNYAFHKDNYQSMSFSGEELNSSSVPALYMDDVRWAYEDNFSVKTGGCAAVSLTMANLYLRNSSDVDPVKIMRYAKEMDYAGTFGGIKDENISAICDTIGLKVEVTNLSENMNKISHADPEKIKSAIDSDHVIMAGMSGETFGVHAIIIRDYSENDFFINDPADPEKTAQTWLFEILDSEMVYIYDISKKQIKS